VAIKGFLQVVSIPEMKTVTQLRWHYKTTSIIPWWELLHSTYRKRKTAANYSWWNDYL